MVALPAHTQVLIVGAGPTGLALGIELRRRQIDCLVIDQLDAPQPWSKALGMHARTLEIMEAMGVRDSLQQKGLPIEGMNLYGHRESRLFHLDFTRLDAPYPWVLSCPQSTVEQVLAARYAELGGQLVRGARLGAFEQVDHRVIQHVHYQGKEQVLESALLVGCDGVHSTVRQTLGIAFSGVSYSDHFLMADVQLDWSFPHQQSHVFLLEQGALLALPLPDGWRLVLSGVDEDVVRHPELSVFAERFEAALGKVPAISDVSWLSHFSIQRRLAENYRRNRVFLAGDACHVQSPLGGQGMNTGIADAFNLGWKLAAYLHDQAGGRVLDSYEQERRPVARQMVYAIDAMSRASFSRNVLVRGVRDRFLQVVGKTDAFGQRLLRRLSQQQVNYRGSSLSRCGETLGRRFFEKRTVQPGDRVPDVTLCELGQSQPVTLHSLFGTGRFVLLIDANNVSAHHVAIAAFSLAERMQTESRFELDLVLVVPGTLPDALSGIREFGVRVFQDVLFCEQQDQVEAASDGERPATPSSSHMSSQTPSGEPHEQGAPSLNGSQTHASFASRFGDQGAIWLVRPDGYLGYRTIIEDAASVMTYLEGAILNLD